MQTRTAMMDAQGQAIGVLIASLDISEKHWSRRCAPSSGG
jgi:hypothetical protein